MDVIRPKYIFFDFEKKNIYILFFFKIFDKTFFEHPCFGLDIATNHYDKVQFWTVFGQNGQNGDNYQKNAWNIFLALTRPH